jgi:hypothetical protein
MVGLDVAPVKSDVKITPELTDSINMDLEGNGIRKLASEVTTVSGFKAYRRLGVLDLPEGQVGTLFITLVANDHMYGVTLTCEACSPTKDPELKAVISSLTVTRLGPGLAPTIISTGVSALALCALFYIQLLARRQSLPAS